MLLATIERFPFLFELQQAAHKIRINILPQKLLREDVTGFTTMRMWVQSTAKRANIIDTGMEKGERRKPEYDSPSIRRKDYTRIL